MGNLRPDWLMQTIFERPVLRDGNIPHCRWLDQLHTAIRTHPLSPVSAPVGFCKTTLLASVSVTFSATSITWICLDEQYNDSARFLAALVATWRHARSAIDTQLYAVAVNPFDPTTDSRRVTAGDM